MHSLKINLCILTTYKHIFYNSVINNNTQRKVKKKKTKIVKKLNLSYTYAISLILYSYIAHNV